MFWVQMQPWAINWTDVTLGFVAVMMFLGLCVIFRIHWSLLDIHEELHDIGTELKKARKRETS
jgi:hypothetical protein